MSSTDHPAPPRPRGLPAPPDQTAVDGPGAPARTTARVPAQRGSRHHVPGPATAAGPVVPRWPATAGRRWVSRALMAVPFLLVAVWTHTTGQVSGATRDLVVAAGVAFDASGPFGGVRVGYPPLPILVAALPAGALLVDLVAALAAGLAAHAVTERLVRRHVPTWLVALLVVVVLGLIGLGLRFTADPSGFVALCLLVVALDGVTRFAGAGDTHGGFVAGLLVAAAFLTDPRVVPFALALGTMSPLIARQRYRGQRGAARATAAVLLFPTVAAVAAWTFLEWRFTGRPGMVTELFVVPDRTTLAAAGALVGAALVMAPLYLAVGAMLAVRRPLALLAYAFAPLGLGLTVLLADPWSPGRGVALLSLVAAMAVPASPRPRQLVVLGAACAVQAAVVLLALR